MRLIPATLAALGLLAAGLGTVSSSHAQPGASAARFDGEGRMLFPADYREWVFLSAGRGMSYSPVAA